MKRIFLAAALLFMSGPALADIANGLPQYQWVNPTTWSDGTPLTAAQITAYQINCTGAATVNKRVAAASGVPPFTVPSTERYAPGAYTCTLAVYAKQTAAAAEILGIASNPVNFTVPQPRPNAATGFSVD